MKLFPRRLAALLLSAALFAVCALSGGPAWALSPEELGEILKNEYAGPIPGQVWQQTTVEGMLAALGDPFSHYYAPSDYAAFLDRANNGAASEANGYRVENAVGWVTLNHFGDVPALNQWVVQTDPAVHGWVIDLRGNRGGELTAAVDALSLFAGGGQLVYIQGGDGKLYGVRRKNCDYTTIYPSIVLIGGDTASAAELFAASLRDRQKALLIGERTYGKGVAQTTFDQSSETYAAAFADGSGLLLTTNFVYSDAMLCHNVTGVLPHLVVEPGQAEAVAALLSAAAPGGDTAGYLRLHLAHWRWFIDLTAADPAALQTLLEALPPQAELYQGAGADSWQKITPAQVAADQGLRGYAPRCFPDLADSPYADAINALKTYGIVQGDEAGEFHPDEGMTRASLCALLAQAMGYPKSSAAPAFADTPADAWYTPYVTTLSALGVVNGCGDGLFHPDDPIPHQQFMTILARVMANTDYESAAALKAGPSQAALDSGDYAAYDPWAVPGAWLLDGSWHEDARDIDPRAVTTRAEAAYDLWSALSTLGILPG